MTTPTEQDIELVHADIRYRQGGSLRRAARIETSTGLIRVRTEDGVQLVAPIDEISGIRGSWWRPGGFSFVVAGQRHWMAASIRGGPGEGGSVWFTDVDVIDMVLFVVYVAVSPLVVVYLVRTRLRWVRILRGALDPEPLAEAARARAAHRERSRPGQPGGGE